MGYLPLTKLNNMMNKKQFLWFGIYFVALIGYALSHKLRTEWYWAVISLVSVVVFGGLVGMLIAKAGRAEYLQKIVDKIYEEE